MSGIYNHRQITPGGAGGSSRFNELLEALKQEYDSLQQEAMAYKMQREEFEHKEIHIMLKYNRVLRNMVLLTGVIVLRLSMLCNFITRQLNLQQQTDEVSMIRQGLYELQNTQKNIKQQYDAEIRNLQREIEQQRLHAHPSSSTHPQPPPSHPPPQPPPPAIGQGQSNLFGTIISGNGPQSLVAPPQMLDPAQSANQQGHPYPGPGGPPQSVPQSGGSTAPSPYLNGGGPPGQSHTTKRPRIGIEDGLPQGPQAPIGIPPNTQQSPAGLYGSNVVPPPQPGQQGPPLNPGYASSVGQSNKPVNKTK
ncbi:2161_t:CDS:2, partial [Acaulospora morrowiae]